MVFTMYRYQEPIYDRATDYGSETATEITSLLTGNPVQSHKLKLCCKAFAVVVIILSVSLSIAAIAVTLNAPDGNAALARGVEKLKDDYYVLEKNVVDVEKSEKDNHGSIVYLRSQVKALWKAIGSDSVKHESSAIILAICIILGGILGV